MVHLPVENEFTQKMNAACGHCHDKLEAKTRATIDRWAAVGMLLVPLLAGLTFGQSAPPEPRALTWGATVEAVMQTYPSAQCVGEPTPLSDWRCILRDTTVNAIPVDVVIYGYMTGSAPGMVGVTFGFASADVHRIVDTLAARYGPWSRLAEPGFVTKADERVPSAVWLWHLPRVEIRVEQNRGTLGHGQAMVMWCPGLAELSARERTQPRRDEGDTVEAPQ